MIKQCILAAIEKDRSYVEDYIARLELQLRHEDHAHPDRAKLLSLDEQRLIIQRAIEAVEKHIPDDA